jgi:WD40 repeat protein
MKPISLHGHEKSITQIKYNREGDLLFSCAKDKQPNVWYSINGERLGTYDGHAGAVWSLDVDWQTKYFLSAAADNSVRFAKRHFFGVTSTDVSFPGDSSHTRSQSYNRELQRHG